MPCRGRSGGEYTSWPDGIPRCGSSPILSFIPFFHVIGCWHRQSHHNKLMRSGYGDKLVLRTLLLSCRKKEARPGKQATVAVLRRFMAGSYSKGRNLHYPLIQRPTLEGRMALDRYKSTAYLLPRAEMSAGHHSFLGRARFQRADELRHNVYDHLNAEHAKGGPPSCPERRAP